MSIVTKNLTPRIGTEVQTDVETLMSGAVSPMIRSMLEERGVVAVRRLNMSDEQQVAFTKTLGAIVDEGVNNIYKITMDQPRTSRHSI